MRPAPWARRRRGAARTARDGFFIDRANRRLVASATLLVQIVGVGLLARAARRRRALRGMRPLRVGCRESDDAAGPHPGGRVAAGAIQCAGRSGSRDQSDHVRLRSVTRRRRARLERGVWPGARGVCGAPGDRGRPRRARAGTRAAATPACRCSTRMSSSLLDRNVLRLGRGYGVESTLATGKGGVPRMCGRIATAG